MRRIAFVLLGLAVLGAYWACTADAPAPTPPNSGGHPGGTSPLQIVLFAGDANPTAGTCTLIQAIVTLNGVAVADGTGVSFSTDFGTFSQNGSPVISVTTQKGSALTALCSNLTGTAFVNATASVSGNAAKAEPLKIVFQPTAQALPFFSSCSPSFGPATGGTSLVINGGRFPGSAATTRATFTALGITREALVTSVTGSAVTVTTPAFPEAANSSAPVAITLTFLANSSPIVLSVPNCFAFGTFGAGTPTITAILPSSGSKDGNTRVSIIGTGFLAPVQVFLNAVEVTVVSVSFNQIVILTPPAFAFGPAPPINTPLDVRVHEVNSGVDATLKAAFMYVLPIQITSIDPVQMRTDSIRPLTIFGHGFRAPVVVSVASLPATVISVSDSELQVLPATPAACGAPSGAVIVTNVSTGETATGPGFTYISTAIAIISTFPSSGPAGTSVTITGTNLPKSTSDADVRFGGVAATVTSAASDGSSIVVTVPAGVVTIPPVCPATNTSVPVSIRSRSSGCFANTGFDYTSPCATATPTPVPATPTFTPTP